MDKKIVVFGSSISLGAWGEEGGWVDRVKKFAHKKVVETGGGFHSMVYNQAVSGDTSVGVLKRFEGELALRRSEGEEELVLIFEVGINDSLYLNAEREFMVPKKVFGSNVVDLIKRARGYTELVMFLGGPPVVDSILDPVPWYPSGTYKTEYVKEYNDILSEICSENGVVYTDIFSPLVRAGVKKIQSIDGVHPSTKGHQVYFEVMKAVLEKEGIL
jgi:lysophospholipase L1-like esterase